jgi:nitrous oxide reductase accessory protein NosL
MKTLLIILILFFSVVSCEKAEDTEIPLIMTVDIEPSTTMCNREIKSPNGFQFENGAIDVTIIKSEDGFFFNSILSY